ncbi:hypothetical protein MtrunA17_Chr3g0084751 [Medicago truncatula]|uniref:Uncharacterized protein n=1 Tax=Medicago truncatula TaxID=3880 RepID=A0A396IJW7_MEDTR|nr:hypothetical protein MtrunA17_Chr3g0084751 [Medicago truncatula]
MIIYFLFKRIHALSDWNHLRRLSCRLSIARFLGLNSDGKEEDGYPLQSRTFKQFGRI